jgi:GNAT superfamily N-acetyltransferase
MGVIRLSDLCDPLV